MTSIKEVRAAIGNSVDTIGKNRAGLIIARLGFFYTHGRGAELFASDISKMLTSAGIKHSIKDSGEVRKPFRGGASTAQGSHWWVSIALLDDALVEQGSKDD